MASFIFCMNVESDQREIFVNFFTEVEWIGNRLGARLYDLVNICFEGQRILYVAPTHLGENRSGQLPHDALVCEIRTFFEIPFVSYDVAIFENYDYQRRRLTSKILLSQKPSIGFGYSFLPEISSHMIPIG